ncbi:transmembrane protein 256-like isoform X2 [Clarias gariepinus]|uniref:transmembrane protein 256-like isoform X2 n=1 Tax=Clarias gariepinus TaxID=13013 RepID=UPI00234CFBA0|nr:transmembrane protein 256-like isoform X2 [Clarias gariepinus]
MGHMCLKRVARMTTRERCVYLQLYRTATTYHFYHSLALLGASQCRKPALAGAILLTGMGCFCGPLYHQALTGDPSLSKLAPIGGVLFIVGWLAMAV